MPLSRCPSCGRAFTPPPGVDPLNALCPLCDGPIRQEPPAPSPGPDSPDRRELPDLRLGLSPADAAAMKAAVTWLSWAGGCGLLHALTTGCFLFGIVSNLLGLEYFGTTPVVFLLLGILAAQLAAFTALIRGAAAFTGHAPILWAWVAFVVSLFLGFIHLGVGLGVSLILGRFDVNAVAGLGLALICVYAAVRTLRTLLRPGVSRHLAGLERRA